MRKKCLYLGTSLRGIKRFSDSPLDGGTPRVGVYSCGGSKGCTSIRSSTTHGSSTSISSSTTAARSCCPSLRSGPGGFLCGCCGLSVRNGFVHAPDRGCLPVVDGFLRLFCGCLGTSGDGFTNGHPLCVSRCDYLRFNSFRCCRLCGFLCCLGVAERILEELLHFLSTSDSRELVCYRLICSK